MPKDIPDCPKRPEAGRLPSRTYEMELKTPLFGGGADVRKNDRDHPIRETSIRGQLRFWWRATHGGRFTDPLDLWLREEEIFGSTGFPSPVRVQAERESKDPPGYAEQTKRSGPAGYTLFALQQGDRLLREGLKFRVTITWLTVEQLNRRCAAVNEQRAKAKQQLLPAKIEAIEGDLRDAVWAWVNFGGLGGRTRRGCGTLWCKELAPNSVAEVGEWFQRAVQRCRAQPGSAPLWPRLEEHLFYHSQAEDAVSAWLRVMEVLRMFRQGEVGREPGRGNRPGRSRFPEPETIRETIRNRGQRGGTHPPLGDVPKDAFPRAEFGLPIVFQFQNKEVDETYSIRGSAMNSRRRMASPLILKALCLANGTAVSAIIPLVVPWFTEVELTRGGRKNVENVFPLSAVRRPDLATYKDSPSPLAGSPAGSAIEAFLAFAQNADNKFRRV